LHSPRSDLARASPDRRTEPVVRAPRRARPLSAETDLPCSLPGRIPPPPPSFSLHTNKPKVEDDSFVFWPSEFLKIISVFSAVQVYVKEIQKPYVLLPKVYVYFGINSGNSILNMNIIFVFQK
jgi:hypothetical protein